MITASPLEKIVRIGASRKSLQEDLDWMSSVYCDAVAQEILQNEGKRWRRVDREKRKSVSDTLEKLIRRPDSGCLLVALQGEQRVGYFLGMIKECLAEEPSRIGYVNGLYVLEEQRRLGIGQRLLNAGNDWFRSCGLTLVEIYAAWENNIAKDFWIKNGFHPTEVVMLSSLK